MILYIETNFLMSVAKGRDIDAAKLLRNLSPLIRLAIPAIMDNLILQCIVSHANQHPHDQKVFISGNTKDFGKKEVREVLNSAKIKYFSNTKNFLGWLDSQCS
jgi:hypothetical protein